MMAIPAGRFEQGSSAEDVDATPFERPRHTVSISYSFGMGLNEVSLAEFKEFVEATARPMNGCETYDGAWRLRSNASWYDIGYPQTALHPVSCVSWIEARDYTQWLSRKTGHKYRLPSASEWEYAARSDAAANCDRANIADETAANRYPGWKVAACRDGHVHAAPVGSFAPNALGLHDMLGNVFEWTADCWRDNYTDAPVDGSAQTRGDCRQREMRGGSWFTSPAYVRTAYRNRFADDYRSASVGFRVVRDLHP
jgi:formylglycine-generating enzyme required for sulfatase activity